MILVLVPAAALWCFYFAHHWRGRAIFTECRSALFEAIKHPIVWLIAALAVFWILGIFSPAVRSAA